ncbi:MAG: hypothetical protein D6773_09465 [Alphaproteobacteria bacterium]|nr:MAG: hypothetical protein D6773_09465 [Alphaproteobacteria bacterium]
MEFLWIPVSILAGLMQAVRTAAQKDLNARLSTAVTTYVRAVFGMPVLLLYLWGIHEFAQQPLPAPGTAFWLHCAGASLAQVLGTVFLIQLFRLRNFAVGTTLIKTDVMMTAVIGSLFFSEAITPAGWLAVALSVTGVILITVVRTPSALLHGAAAGGGHMLAPTLTGLGSALSFTFSYLFLREASLSLGADDFLMRAGFTAVVVTALQLVFLGLWIRIREPGGLRAMIRDWKLSSFIGVTSAIGSICWFTAMTLENASYVRAVGQVETIFTLLISHYYFRERLWPAEFLGIAVIVAGVLVFVL